MAVIPIEKTRQAWACASSFPTSKESVYSEHAVVQEFDEHHGKHVLEYGCGGGSDAMSYLRRGNSVTLVDVTPINVRVAGQRIADMKLPSDVVAAGIELASSAPLPLPDEEFDLVNSHGVLHHIVDPLPVVREFHRVLRKGGLVYIMLYTEQLRARLDSRVTQLVTWKGLSEAEAFCWLTDEPGCPYAVPYTDQQGRALLETAGFRVIKSTLYNRDDFRCFKGIKE